MTLKKSTGLGGISNLSVLAPIKSGMVIGFDPVSYLERLRKVLDALFSARQNTRESELLQPIFPDVIGQFSIIHHFRYAIVPPDPGMLTQSGNGISRLSLNVTFDGGWETYMRVIYRDIGTLLDLLFCHCEGYPGSRTSRFETYCAWVRANEVEAGTFYADSAMPLGDHPYLAAVEKAQREHGDRATLDAEIARLAVPSAARQQADAMSKAMANRLGTLVLPLRTLKGLYRLSIYFPSGNAANNGGEMGTLRRFAQSILEGPLKVMQDLNANPGSPQESAIWAKTRVQLADELAWLKGPPAAPVAPVAALPYNPAQLQAHILGSAELITHGCMVLLRVENAQQAIAHLASVTPKCGPMTPGGIGYLCGFTYAGLQALGISSVRLNEFPQEFIEGMESRCAVLGDVRGNHPDRWRRPVAYWQQPGGGRRIDMRAVHIVIQLRMIDATNTSSTLHPTLRTAVDALQAAGTGLRVLAVEPTRSYRNQTQQTTGHLDFVDGISQPQFHSSQSPAIPAVAHSDLVSAGELLLGHGNDRGDAPNPAIGPLLMNGTYLVVRKIRQRVDHVDSAMAGLSAPQRDELLAHMMGRQSSGTPLAPLSTGATGLNDFNYTAPVASDACPFHSHIRRANPRDGRPYIPRILRRGVSYGPKSTTDRTTERGVIFLAYCASIAEQFETIQRWIAGGNSSGVGSSQGDPFLRVPQAGESYTFRYFDGNGSVARFTFDDKPLAQLEWGVYLFVPPLAVLAGLNSYVADPPAPVAQQPLPPVETPAQQEAARDVVRQRLDDPDKAPAAWALVRAGDASLQGTPYGKLLGTQADVFKALKDHTRSEYSVKGYGDRMTASIGLNLLGLDPGPERTEQMPLNAAILSIGEKAAYDATAPIVKSLLTQFPDLPPLNLEDPVRRPIDLVSFSDFVMAALCKAWIGLPDTLPPAPSAFMQTGGRLEENAGIPRCPGNFATASRYIFSPHPRAEVQQAGCQQGQSVLKAVKDWLQRGGTPGTLAATIKTQLGPTVSEETYALSLAGVLLGFPPTVQGNFIRSMETWIKDEALWQHQQALFESTTGVDPTYDEANAALRGPLFATMRRRPVPEMLWRTPVEAGVVNEDANMRVVLGLTSALTDPTTPNELIFGRDKAGAAQPTVHGCPGYAMAMGVLLAMFAGLMNAGTLRPTGSPVLLILTPP